MSIVTEISFLREKVIPQTTTNAQVGRPASDFVQVGLSTAMFSAAVTRVAGQRRSAALRRRSAAPNYRAWPWTRFATAGKAAHGARPRTLWSPQERKAQTLAARAVNFAS